MFKVGLTGNIGSGKSTVCSIFSLLGIKIYHADSASKKFLGNEEVIHELIHYFGKEILSSEGNIDRGKLASIVFSDETSLKLLNSILHPLVKQDFHGFIAQNQSEPYILHEAAILYESGFAKEFDRIIHVFCPKEMAIQRVMKRDLMDGQMVLKRMGFQMDNERKAELSDFVIRNDGSLLVIPQVLSIHQTLLQLCSQCNDNIPSGTANA